MTARWSTLGVVALALALGASGPAEAGSRKKRKPVRRARVALTKQRAPQIAERRSPTLSTAPTPEARLREELQSIWGSRILRRGVTAIYVVDAKSGNELYSIHADDKLNPASNVKLISTATVLDALGPEWRYVTRLFGPAPTADGTLHGSLYLHGSGDPLFGRAALDELARKIAARGIKRVEGDVVLSDSLLRDTLSGSTIEVVVDGGGKPGSAPTFSVRPATTFVEVVSKATISTKRRAQLTASSRIIDDPVNGARLRIELGGSIRRGQRRTIARPVERRSSFTAHALREALRVAGVELTGQPRLASFEDYTADAGQHGYLPITLASHSSAPLRELVAQVNKRSINWLADRLVMTAGAELEGAAPSINLGVKAMKSWLKRAGLNPDELVVDTGSGLSYATKLSARQLVRVLRFASGNLAEAAPATSGLDGDTYRQTLSVGGVDGTLRGRFTRALKGAVIGKTGTLTGCIALTGLVSAAGNDEALCFSIVTNGNRHNARTSVRREHDEMVVAMRRYLEARALTGAVSRAAAAAKAAVTPAPAAATTAVPAAAPVDAAAEDDGADELPTPSEVQASDAEPDPP
jgi:D-alanyl-D-alanine carboxypeptidase/D-alanyl-D-alanine-endopeptidase (penicillin-binding protein 4)